MVGSQVGHFGLTEQGALEGAFAGCPQALGSCVGLILSQAKLMEVTRCFRAGVGFGTCGNVAMMVCCVGWHCVEEQPGGHGAPRGQS